MTTLQFPLRFLDAVRIGDDDTVYYVVGLVPEWRIRSFVAWVMTAPDGIETWAPLNQVRVIQEDDDRGRLPFLRAMKLSNHRQRLLARSDHASELATIRGIAAGPCATQEPGRR